MEKTVLQQKLAKRMKSMGFTMKSLSKAAGKNETYVRDIIEGRVKNPSYSNLKSIAEQLSCTVEDLMEVGGLKERGGTAFSGFARLDLEKSVDSESLVSATLLLSRQSEKQKLNLNKTEITKLAKQVCSMAKEHGNGVVTENLVNYVLEINQK